MAADAGQLFCTHPTRGEKISKADAKLAGLGLSIRAVFTPGVPGAGAPHIASDEFNHTFRNTPFPGARFA